jgi:hypothetical protein
MFKNSGSVLGLLMSKDAENAMEPTPVVRKGGGVQVPGKNI